MNNKRYIKVLIIVFAIIAIAVICGNAYSKYILNRNLLADFSSTPFYFEVEDATANRIYALKDQTATLNIKASNGDQTNEFATEYTITLEENGIFTFESISGTIEANKKEKKVDLALKLKQDFTQKGGSITFVVKTSNPYVKEVKVNVPVNKLGDYVLELGKDKTCYYHDKTWGDQNPTIIQTDSACNDPDGGYDDTPPYHKYLMGTNKCLDFNYVWYSGYMWRITEILNDGSVKMITENVLSAINFGETGDFEDSYIKQWLNENFLDTLYNYKNILVTDATWDISPWYNWCYIAPPHQTIATVGLLSAYEFNKTSAYGKDSFLNLGHNWWFSSPNGFDEPAKAVDGMTSEGILTGWNVPSTAYGVRPMVVLKDDVKFSGKGTHDDPFVLLDDIPAAKEGDKINTRTPGELVEINNMLYRIVNTHIQNGQKVTKLKSAYYVKDENGDLLTKPFGDMKMTTYGEIVDSKNEEYWGAYLNNTWLREQDIKQYLVEDTYYVDPVQNDPTDGSNIGSYKNAICKNKNTTETTKECEKTTNTWTGYVGLPIVGELFAYPLGGTDVHDYLTATMTPYGNGSYPMIGAFKSDSQGIDQHTHSEHFAVKPTITLNEDVIIIDGDGRTPQTAFKIGLPNEKS